MIVRQLFDDEPTAVADRTSEFATRILRTERSEPVAKQVATATSSQEGNQEPSSNEEERQSRDAQKLYHGQKSHSGPIARARRALEKEQGHRVEEPVSHVETSRAVTEAQIRGLADD
ncbi:unnamed protein product [Trichogramma brassicae]|uniref:Uncharacterized protein n=1 Tax=Trichogramma brassicae TaxID=86971 RepID=A0A6H5I4X0_9HYME|nr:unnamed protein product [Trichogramma brassicae]